MKHEPIDLFGNIRMMTEATKPGGVAYLLFNDWPEALLEVRCADGIHVLGVDYGGDDWLVRGTSWRRFHGGPFVLRDTYQMSESKGDDHATAA